jgi:hypothetical protein
MSAPIRIWFSDFWPYFDPNNNYFINLFRKHYDVILDDSNPEFLFFSVFGFKHLKYMNSVRIQYIAENLRPNYWESDFSISFDYDDYRYRNIRLPLYVLYGGVARLLDKQTDFRYTEVKPKFCNLISSNPNAEYRNKFFKLLNLHKHVDSGGSHLNNIGFTVQDKLEFINEYRFSICFENSHYPGYTTEKIYEAMTVGSIPIYWGNKRISEEFNTKSFINVHDYKNLDAVIENIMDFENNPRKFIDLLSQPWMIPDKHTNYFDEERILNFFDSYVFKKKKYTSSFTERKRNIAAYISVTKKRIYSKIFEKPYCAIQ